MWTESGEMNDATPDYVSYKDLLECLYRRDAHSSEDELNYYVALVRQLHNLNKTVTEQSHLHNDRLA